MVEPAGVGGVAVSAPARSLGPGFARGAMPVDDIRPLAESHCELVGLVVGSTRAGHQGAAIGHGGTGVVDMGSFSLMHWIVVLAIVLILFGAGKLPRVMGDFAKGIKAFKAGMHEDDEESAAPAQVPPPNPAATTAASAEAAGERPRQPV
jgi:sec-independent protein translocase protein TatA